MLLHTREHMREGGIQRMIDQNIHSARIDR